jgi:hypothetical protein
MNFEYEITADDYAAAQSLDHRLSGGRRRIQNTVSWIVAGVFFMVVAWNQRPADWAQFLLGALGAWWIYAGIMNLLLPARYFRRHYLTSALAGKKFRAVLGEHGFDVTGDGCSWRVEWQGVRFKGENKRVFMVCSFGTIFIFSKQYLTNHQQAELRGLAGLGPTLSLDGR